MPALAQVTPAYRPVRQQSAAAAQQQQVAASQLSGTAGAFMEAANQMMAAAKAFNTAASRPINVNIGSGLGTQGQ